MVHYWRTGPRRVLVFYFLALLPALLVGCRSAVYAQPLPTLPTSTARPTQAASPTVDALPTYTLAPLPYVPKAARTARPKTAAARPTVPSIAARATATARNTPDPNRAYPIAHTITDISGHKQLFELGCEASAAVDWARYLGVEIDEYGFQAALPASDNPDKGFVGDVHGRWGQIPPFAYGVHAAPVAEQLRRNGLPAVAYKGYTLEQLKMAIARNEPVIAWVIGNVGRGQPVQFVDKDGNSVTVAPYEHVVIVTGYDDEADRIRYLNNGRLYDASSADFLNSWGVLGNMVVVKEASALPTGEAP